MVKKYITIKLCILLLAITAWPLPSLTVEEAVEAKETLGTQQYQVVVNYGGAKENSKNHRYQPETQLKTQKCGILSNEAKPRKQLCLLQSRFYLSAYLEMLSVCLATH